MFRKTNKGYWEFEEFKKFKNLIHGFSTRLYGDCREEKNCQNFLKALDLEPKSLILAQQVHKNKIKAVRDVDRGKIIPGVDGLLTRDWQVVLGIRSADCLPILFWEPRAKIIGAAHAGWRGILARLPQKMVDQMIRMGGLPENILVAIGPHICGKCYSVEKNRLQQFLAEFGRIKGMGKGNCLDLEIPVINQLFHSGISLSHIFSASLCTSCDNDEFFSYRKETENTYGEMLSVISLII
ncbi:MAG: peptidoglycan editing factor PgeF [Microgenomates group bacterium]